MSKKPNILFILTDDQGPWAINCAGTQELYTPNLNRIAANGMRFDNFFCVSPVCSPARASILTGNIPSAHGVHDWLEGGNVDRDRFKQFGQDSYTSGYVYERTAILYLEGQLTYTDILSQNGYICALAGKWHLGDSINPQHGFSRWYTLGRGGCNHYYHPDIVEDGNITLHHGEYVSELFADKTIEYLKEFSSADKPFYISVHFNAPHSPWGEGQHPKKWMDYYENCDFASIPDIPDHPDMVTGPVYGTERRKERLRGYFAAVSAMDEQVGRILDVLEDKGLADDTVIIFTSDNGMCMGQHGVWGKGNGTFPMNMYDSSIKVPFLISYPKLIPAGTVCSHMVSAYDLFPTLIHLAGLNMPADVSLPGKSFVNCLNSEKEKQKDEEIVVFDEYGPVRMIRNREWKYVHRYPYGKHELYHISVDSLEEHNLYGDPQYENQVITMKNRMERWFNQYVNPEVDGSREGVTGCGQMCRAGIYGDRNDIYVPLGT